MPVAGVPVATPRLPSPTPAPDAAGVVDTTLATSPTSPVALAVPVPSQTSATSVALGSGAGLPSPTPATVVGVAGNGASSNSASPASPTSVFGFNAVEDAHGLPATPPETPRTGARPRRLIALGLPLSSPPSGGRSVRSGTWSPAVLGLSNGVAPGTLLPGGSSNEDLARGSMGRR